MRGQRWTAAGAVFASAAGVCASRASWAQCMENTARWTTSHVPMRGGCCVQVRRKEKILCIFNLFVSYGAFYETF